MPHYDYIFYNSKKLHQSRDLDCYSNIFKTTIADIERISVFAFPKGNLEINYPVSYGFSNAYALLEEYNTSTTTGVERWAEFLGRFIPGTSYMEEYDEIPSIFGSKIPMCEFRLEVSKKIFLSAIMRQIWLNGVRYCWENNSTQYAKFCLTYYRKEMKPFEVFNLYLLSHAISTEYNHVTLAQNPKRFTEEVYNKLLIDKSPANTGTLLVGSKLEYDNNYIIKKTSYMDMVYETNKKIFRKDTANIPKLESFYKDWNNYATL